eukprot:GFUD01062374.1.p1 GENE.GFUD01062374.1~~GFUD01062374.1.p1  ORF type:complete len:327 (-),score=62.90 GFUD01062374.1:140-1120(-)
MDSFMILFLMLLKGVPLMCEDIYLEHPDMVEESIHIQGRNVKLLVAVPGEILDLKCEVTFTSQPANKIVWKINEEPVRKPNDQIEHKETKNGKVIVVIEDNYEISITKEMDGSKMSCGYHKGQYTGKAVVVLRVFQPEIEISEEVCDNCNGNVRLIFKERSPLEANVDKRIKQKITKLTGIQSEEISVHNSEYSVLLPIDKVKDNEEILDILNGATIDALDKCECTSNNWIWIVIAVIAVIAAAVVAAFVIACRFMSFCFWSKSKRYRGEAGKGVEAGERGEKSLEMHDLNENSGVNVSELSKLCGVEEGEGGESLKVYDFNLPTT